MKNSKALFRELIAQVTIRETREEVDSMIYMALEDVLGLKQSDVMAGKQVNMSVAQQDRLTSVVARLNRCEPIQYILGYTYFMGRKFIVDNSVLIPRPETEELVHVVIDEINSRFDKNTVRIVDVGTGSGCIPVSLSLIFQAARVFATDVSREALAVAELNNRSLGSRVKYLHSDILTDKIPVESPDIIVSNPPYVMRMESARMNSNVIEYEPDVALFVPDEDPLLFYKVIADRAKAQLTEGGLLVFEINELFGKDMCELLRLKGFREIQLIRDINAKDRIVKAYR